MNGLLHTCRRLIGDLLPRTLWRCLVAYGSLYLAPVPAEAAYLLSVIGHFGYVSQHVPPNTSDPLAAGLGGLPPGHPERLEPEVPLTDGERLLAAEVWPVRRPGRAVPPGPPQRRRGRSAR